MERKHIYIFFASKPVIGLTFPAKPGAHIIFGYVCTSNIVQLYICSEKWQHITSLNFNLLTSQELKMFSTTTVFAKINQYVPIYFTSNFEVIYLRVLVQFVVWFCKLATVCYVFTVNNNMLLNWQSIL